MICFLDRTFCSNPDCIGKCGRQWTKELEERSKRWWWGSDEKQWDKKAIDMGYPPVAFSDFCS